MKTKKEADTLFFAETPEGVELALRPAGPVIRFLAFIIDSCIRLFLYIILAIILSIIKIFGNWLYFLCIFLIEWFYCVFFEVLHNGKTPGKNLMGLKVIMHNGSPVGWNASILRNLLRAADVFMFVIYIFGLVSMMFTKGFKRLGDLAAGTIVVYSRDTYYLNLPVNHKLQNNITPAPPLIPLTAEEQIAIVSFSSRVNTLGKSRAKELAEIIADEFNNKYKNKSSPQDDSITSVLSISAWLSGNLKK